MRQNLLVAADSRLRTTTSYNAVLVIPTTPTATLVLQFRPFKHVLVRTLLMLIHRELSYVFL